MDDDPRFYVSRRVFVSGSLALTVAAGLPGRAWAATSQFDLTPRAAKVDLVGPGYPATAVWAYDGQVPGREIRVRQDETIRVAVTNGLAEPTTVHWHGLRLPHAMDGVPDLTQPAIPPGASFTYEFVAPDAGTFWYHPHVRSDEQVGRGLYGPLIVEEKNPPAVDRDITWAIDDWRLTNQAQLADFGMGMDMSHGGRLGNLVTVNGKRMDDFPVRAGERIRLRLINTANARLFGLRFDGHDPMVIALDGHPVKPHAPDGGMVVLGPGMRADIILDCTLSPGATATITDALYTRNTYEFATVRYSDDRPLRENPPDGAIALAANPVAEPDVQAALRHEVVISGGAMGSMRGAVYKGEMTDIRDLVQYGKIWSLNGVAAHGMKMDPMLTLKKGASHAIRIVNDTAWPHPLHLHGHAFRILKREGRPVPHHPWADTILLAAREEAEIALVADNPGDWLFHCHILEHHVAGMASVIRVA